MMRRAWTIGLVALLLPGWASAQGMSNSPCTLPQLMMAWQHTPNSGAVGAVGQPHRLTLAPCQGPSCKPESHDAAVTLTIGQAGRYRVAIDSMAWIDLLGDGKPLDSVLCEHSGCAPIRKIVQYDVDHPGQFSLRLEGKRPGDVTILVAPVQD